MKISASYSVQMCGRVILHTFIPKNGINKQAVQVYGSAIRVSVLSNSPGSLQISFDLFSCWLAQVRLSDLASDQKSPKPKQFSCQNDMQGWQKVFLCELNPYASSICQRNAMFLSVCVYKILKRLLRVHHQWVATEICTFVFCNIWVSFTQWCHKTSSSFK